MIRKLIFLTVLVAFATVTGLAQQKPDFSGTWKLNVAKSDFGPLPPPESRTDVITHKEPSITDEVSAAGAQGKQQYTAKYTTDGKEVTNQIATREVKSILKWKGSNLVINSTLVYEGSDVKGVGTWSLSADGKTLTISAHYTSAMGEADQKLIFEKQESAAAPAKTP